MDDLHLKIKEQELAKVMKDFYNFDLSEVVNELQGKGLALRE